MSHSSQNSQIPTVWRLKNSHDLYVSRGTCSGKYRVCLVWSEKLGLEHVQLHDTYQDAQNHANAMHRHGRINTKNWNKVMNPRKWLSAEYVEPNAVRGQQELFG